MQESALLDKVDKKEKRGLILIVLFTAGLRGSYAIKTASFEVEEGGCRQTPPSILWFGGSNSFDNFPNNQVLCSRHYLRLTYLKGAVSWEI